MREVGQFTAGPGLGGYYWLGCCLWMVLWVLWVLRVLWVLWVQPAWCM